MTHVDAEVVAEVISQVGERSGRALEVCARHFHALVGESTGSVRYGQCVCVCVRVCSVYRTSSDTLLSMAPNMECKAPTEN